MNSSHRLKYDYKKDKNINISKRDLSPSADLHWWRRPCWRPPRLPSRSCPRPAPSGRRTWSCPAGSPPSSQPAAIIRKSTILVGINIDTSPPYYQSPSHIRKRLFSSISIKKVQIRIKNIKLRDLSLKLHQIYHIRKLSVLMCTDIRFIFLRFIAIQNVLQCSCDV